MVRPAPAKHRRDSAPHRFSASDEQRRVVQVMAAAGMPLADIAAATTPGGVSLATLRRHFAEQLRHGRAKAEAAVARSLFQQACKGNVAACRLWLDRHAPAARRNVKDDIARMLDGLVAGSRRRLERQLARLAAAQGAGEVSS
jgi:hypothetical protein